MNEKHKEEDDDAIPIKEPATIDSDSPEYKNFETRETKLVEDDGANFDERVGQIVGGYYEIIKPIAEGGMSAVYLAKHQLLDQEVALKFILPSLIHDKNTTKRFQSEAKAASLLQHQNIASIREFGIDDTKRPFIVMEYVSGKTLEELLKESYKEDSERTVDLLIQLCNGLEYAHQNGVIHRDLKPANLIIVDDPKFGETLKIVDFGIAKVLRDDDSGPDLTKTGDIFGTPKYMSPEQCLGKSVDIRADIYSVGCILYECLTGNPPFTSNSMLEIMMKHVQDDISFDNEFLTDSFKHVIAKCMAKDPNKRYQNIGDLRKDLNLIRENKSPQILDSPKVSTLDTLSPNERDDRSSDEGINFFHVQRIKGLVIAILTVLIALPSVLIYLTNKQPQLLNQFARSVSTNKIENYKREGIRSLNNGDYNQALVKFSRAYELFTNDETQRDNVDYAEKQIEGLNRILLVTQITNNERLGSKTRLGIKTIKMRIKSKPPSDFNALLKVWEVLERTEKNKVKFDDLSLKLTRIAKTRNDKFIYKDSIKLMSLVVPKLEIAYGSQDKRLLAPVLLLAEATVKSRSIDTGYRPTKKETHLVKSYLRKLINQQKSNANTLDLARANLYLAFLSSGKHDLGELKKSFEKVLSAENNPSTSFDLTDQFIKAIVLSRLNEGQKSKQVLQEIIPKLVANKEIKVASAATHSLIYMLMNNLEYEKAKHYLRQRIEYGQKNKSSSAFLAYCNFELGWIYNQQCFEKLSKTSTVEKGDTRLSKEQHFKNAEKYYLKSLKLIQSRNPNSWLTPNVVRRLANLYTLAANKKKTVVFLKQWIALNELYGHEHKVRSDKSQLATILNSTGIESDRLEAKKIFNNNLKRIYLQSNNSILADDTWFVDLAVVFLKSDAEKTKLLKRFEQSTNTAMLNYKASGIKSNALAEDVFKQLNMLSKLQYQFGDKESSLNSLKELVEFVRNEQVSNFYREQALIKYAQVLKMIGKDKESKAIWAEVKQIGKSS